MVKTNSTLTRWARASVCLLALGATVTAGSPVQAQDTLVDAPASAEISLVASNGTGCKPETANVSQSPDKTSLALLMSDFVVGTNGEFKPADFRKNCVLSLNVQTPAGYQYALAKSVVVRQASIAEGAKLETRQRLSFQGESSDQTTNVEIAGPYTGLDAVDGRTPIENVAWSPCGGGRLLNMNLELRMQKGQSQAPSQGSIMAVVLDSGSHLVWRKC